MVFTSSWKHVLTSCGVKEEHVTEELVSKLCQHRFSPNTFNEESFFGYHQGDNEKEIGVSIAKEYASLNGLQWFLEDAIDWEKAWRQLGKHEGWLLVKVEDATWGLFKEND